MYVCACVCVYTLILFLDFILDLTNVNLVLSSLIEVYKGLEFYRIKVAVLMT